MQSMHLVPYLGCKFCNVRVGVIRALEMFEGGISVGNHCALLRCYLRYKRTQLFGLTTCCLSRYLTLIFHGEVHIPEMEGHDRSHAWRDHASAGS
jgi:hypothetical protein